jgi:hypothetical protein
MTEDENNNNNNNNNNNRVKEMLTFFNKTISKRTPPGQRQSVQNEGVLFYLFILFI